MRAPLRVCYDCRKKREEAGIRAETLDPATPDMCEDPRHEAVRG